MIPRFYRILEYTVDKQISYNRIPIISGLCFFSTANYIKINSHTIPVSNDIKWPRLYLAYSDVQLLEGQTACYLNILRM